MMTLDKFLCCLELETGGLVIGWVALISDFISIIVYLLMAIFPVDACELVHEMGLFDLSCDTYSTVFIVLGIVVVLFCPLFAFIHLGLIKGTKNRNPTQMWRAKIFFTIGVVFSVLCVIGSVTSAGAFIFSIAQLVVVVYIYLVVNALHTKLCKEAADKEFAPKA